MLFNSFVFVGAFLPLTLVGYYALGAVRQTRAALAWLLICSLVYVGWSSPRNLAVLAVSAAFNFAVSRALVATPYERKRLRYGLLACAVVANLGALGFFKYRNFFLQNLNAFLSTPLTLSTLWLPLGISFFTFQQIAYLIGVHRDNDEAVGFLEYAFHLSFFPKLISGPLVDAGDLLPQIRREQTFEFSTKNFVLGVTIFCVGLFKKTFVADQLGFTVGRLYDFAEKGTHLYLLEAWTAIVGYSAQLYYDFSGYSDMAIGVALLFNIALPVNFFSPFKARSVSDFWSRWNITLTAFFKTYVFMPLAKKHPRSQRWQHVCLFVTMTLCGFWHGPSWTLIAYGAIHGAFLVVNYIWRTWKGNRLAGRLPGAVFLTYLSVCLSMVIFRSSNLTVARRVLRGAFGLDGVTLPHGLAHPLGFLGRLGVSFAGIFHPENDLQSFEVYRLLVPALAAIWLLPNIYQLVENELVLHADTSKKKTLWLEKLRWRPSPAWAVALAVISGIGLLGLFSESKEFIYFQF